MPFIFNQGLIKIKHGFVMLLIKIILLNFTAAFFTYFMFNYP